MEKNIGLINQGIKRKFVNQHVYCNVTSLITEILENDCDRWEDVENFYDEEDNPQEVFEWFAVSSFLKDKLLEKGEVFFDDEYWGRGTTGQAILLDGVIENICEELEILYGQKYSWYEEV